MIESVAGVFNFLMGYLLAMTVAVGVLWFRVEKRGKNHDRRGGSMVCERCGGKAVIRDITWQCPSCNVMWGELIDTKNREH
jgi:hypothetical protein